MKEFDYNKYYAVGTVDVSYQGNNNGQIIVCGYSDGSRFVQLDKQQAKDLFPPKGRVFCFNLKRDYHNYQGELVQIEVTPNVKEGDNLDKLVWNFSELTIIGTKVKRINGVFGADGEHNYKILEENGLLNPPEDVFIQSADRIYYVEEKSTPRILPYYNLEDLYLISSDTAVNYIYDEPGLPERRGEVDCTNDSQLIDWLLNKVLEGTDLANILKGDKETILGAAKVFLMKTKISPQIMESRMNRLSNMLGIYQISLQGLQNMSNAPWLKETVDNAIRLYKDNYLTDIIEENKEQIEKINNEHQQAIVSEQAHFDEEMKKIKISLEINEKEYEEILNGLYHKTEDAKEKLNTIQKELDDKQRLLSDAEEKYNCILSRKEEIIKDFSIIKDVLGVNTTSTNIDNSLRDSEMEEISYVDTPLPMYRGINRNIENCLQELCGVAKGANNMGSLLLHYNTLLLPDFKRLMTIITATGKCSYMTVYVSVAWKSFADLWKNGLEYIVGKCYESPNKMHYLVLRNINLTYLPNYMQPIFDIQMGLINLFPGTKVEFPNNLRLLCTATTDEVIPMSAECLQCMGCVEKIEDMNNKGYSPIKNVGEKLKGYLDPELLIKNKDYSDNDFDNHFEYYING